MSVLADLWAELVAVLGALVGAVPYVVAYVALILACGFVWSFIKKLVTPKKDYGSLKTVTFGDESAVTSNTVASVASIVLIFLLWGSFTGSKYLPSFLHMPGAFTGEGTFEYTVTAGDQSDDATVSVVVLRLWAFLWAMRWACPTGSAGGLTRLWNSCAPCRRLR